jgi:hypothetical protein
MQITKLINLSLVTYILSFGIVFTGIYGWIANVITIAGSNFNDLTGLLVLRVIGIFVAPMGAILGFI